MTRASRRIAGGITLVAAIWVFFSKVAANGVFYPSPPECIATCNNAYLSSGVLLIGVLLAIVGLLELWGAWFSYPAGAALSFALLIAALYAYSNPSVPESDGLQVILGAVVAAVAFAANILAVRSGSAVPEQANPMNLPVFG